jgi:predicted regulator of Ras-like GTPase activity (Roadblock/LC7/MglB family)
MAIEPKYAPRNRRREPEPERVVYEETDLTTWAMKLDEFVAPRLERGEVVVAAPADTEDSAPQTTASEAAPTLADHLENLMDFDGALCVALVDSDSGMILGQAGFSADIEVAAAGASVMLRARRSTVKALGSNELIDDLLVTLATKLQIIRPLSKNPTVFIYLLADRAKASLAMARFKATEADGKLVL